MNTVTAKLTEWAVEKIKREYAADVALLVAVDGHAVNADGHGECFDYYVPATERGSKLAQTFIIDGIGYDLYPRTWERTERTATLDDSATSCLGNARILYSRSPEDEARFLAIRTRLFPNLGNGAFTYKKALEKLNVAMDLYRTVMFEDEGYKVRMAVGYIHYYLALAVFYLNGTYRKEWQGGWIPALLALPALPEGFVETYQAIVRAKSAAELKSLAQQLIASARQFIARYKPAEAAAVQTPDFAELANWYQEISLWWRRLYYFCSIGDSDAAFAEAAQLQNEMTIVAAEFGISEMNLLGCFDADNLSALQNRAAELEATVIAEIEHHGVQLKRYNSLAEFLALNQ